MQESGAARAAPPLSQPLTRLGKRRRTAHSFRTLLTPRSSPHFQLVARQSPCPPPAFATPIIRCASRRSVPLSSLLPPPAAPSPPAPLQLGHPLSRPLVPIPPLLLRFRVLCRRATRHATACIPRAVRHAFPDAMHCNLRFAAAAAAVQCCAVHCIALHCTCELLCNPVRVAIAKLEIAIALQAEVQCKSQDQTLERGALRNT